MSQARRWRSGGDGWRAQVLGALAPTALAALALLHAAVRRFVQDDAFISFRYAENWLAGHGLVFNLGEPVEGYTNFLWVLLIAAGLRLGCEVVAWSQALGLVCGAVTLAATWRLARTILPGRPAALLALALLGTNSSFASYVTGGLETQLQAALFTVLVAVLLAHRGEPEWSAGRLLLLSLLGATALMTRPDSALLVAAVCGWVLWQGPRRRRLVAWLLLPGGLLVVPWLAWKLSFYGHLLPNTFYAKTPGWFPLLLGGVFVYSFFQVYNLWPVLLLGPLGVRHWRREEHQPVALLSGFLLLWLVYLVCVGGDFMEYRFLVPVLPMLFVVYVWQGCHLVQQPAVRVLLVLLTATGLVFHQAFFNTGRAIFPGVDACPLLAETVDRAEASWSTIGQALGRQFPTDSGVRIAVMAAGAVPYYSRLETVDMLGLNDAWVARHGLRLRRKAGHQRVAPVRYLVERQVHLVVGQPWPRRAGGPPCEAYPIGEFDRLFGRVPGLRAELPLTARAVEIPLPAGHYLIAVYLTPSAAVDRAAAANGWRLVPITRGGPAGSS